MFILIGFCESLCFGRKLSLYIIYKKLSEATDFHCLLAHFD